MPPVWTPLCVVRCPPHAWTHPSIFGCPPYVWLCPVCLDALQMYGASKGMRDIQTYGSVQRYRGHPNVWGAYDSPLLSDKACFLLLYINSRHPNIFQTYKGHPNILECPNIQEASKHRDAQTYRGLSKHWGIQTYRRCIQIYGGVQTYETSKHRECPNVQGGIQTYGGIQLYGGIWTAPQSDKACLLCVAYVQQASKHVPNIWGHPNIWGCPHLGASKHTGENLNIWGIQTCRSIQTWGHPNIQGIIQTYGASKHTGDASI